MTLEIYQDTKNQDFSSIISTFSFLESGKEEAKNKFQNSSFIQEVVDNFNIEEFTQCGLFILIAQILKKEESKSMEKADAQKLKFASKLLDDSYAHSIYVMPPQSIEPQDFIREMISEAEVVAKRQTPLGHRARALKSCIEVLQEYMSNNFEAKLHHAILKFVNRWQDFTRFFLKDRIDSFFS